MDKQLTAKEEEVKVIPTSDLLELLLEESEDFVEGSGDGCF